MHQSEYTNALISESSPYLLQHAHNPVNWHPWKEETLKQAQEENKLLLISIGYSACHWCHVMEHESFQDVKVAALMNEHFINIKVDREERPDIDQIYMNAIQLMKQGGGWPLNCIALPDGRPVWGGTYFSKDQWVEQVKQVADFYQNNPAVMKDYAQKVTEGIQQSDLVSFNSQKLDVNWSDLDQTIANWQKQFDHLDGGMDRAPKFPLPNNYLFLMRYAHFKKNKPLHQHVQLTLDKMALGGIYDQIGGGFARYSVDKNWKVPHFEKMLYDNAQLVSLYSEAYLAYKNPFYSKIVEEILDFIHRELSTTEGAFYTALDADSEGQEGKYYTWEKGTLQSLLKSDYELFADYYNLDSKGYWENNQYILLRTESDLAFSKRHCLSIQSLQAKVSAWKHILLKKREDRIKPARDEKVLTSWNALMCKAYADAYLSFGKKEYLDRAVDNANFIFKHQVTPTYGLWHSHKDGKSSIEGFLDDYAFCIAAFIRLYEATFEDKWLNKASQLFDYTMRNFKDEESGMFFFTSEKDQPLIARKMEIYDSVIPASCSEMAKNAFILARYLNRNDLDRVASEMLNNMKERIPKYGSGYSNWATLYLNLLTPFYEIAFMGQDAQEKALKFHQKKYVPNKLLMGTSSKSSLSLLKDKKTSKSATIYVCSNKSCQTPTQNVNEAHTFIQ